VASKRKYDSNRTKLEIISAAQRCFSEESYDHVTIRKIAAEANCNSSLIARYFGSKEGLFIEAIVNRFDISHASDLATQVDANLDRLVGAAKLDFDVSTVIFRSAAVTPAKEMLRDALERGFITHLSSLTTKDDRELRAELATAIIYGVNSLRNLLRTRALQSASPQDLSRLLRPLLLALLDPQSK
jgi:AcrR family transcriptional regulator